MAKDLGLHEHHDIHRRDQACGSTPVECLTKTRVWQTLMVCEMMVGGPQGKKRVVATISLADVVQDDMITKLISTPLTPILIRPAQTLILLRPTYLGNSPTLFEMCATFAR